MRFLYILSLAMIMAAPSWAACSNPAGVAGEIIYNSDWKIMQFCDDTDWIAMSGSGAGGNMPAKTIKGNNTNADGPALDLTATQLMNMIIPTGAIWAFDLAICPTGWAEYTPARGRFLRGIDPTGTIDSGGVRAAGNLQADELKSHGHNFSGLTFTPSGFPNNGSGAVALTYGNGFSAPNLLNATGNQSALLDNLGAIHKTGGAETRPKNVAILYCRKS